MSSPSNLSSSSSPSPNHRGGDVARRIRSLEQSSSLSSPAGGSSRSLSSSTKGSSSRSVSSSTKGSSSRSVSSSTHGSPSSPTDFSSQRQHQQERQDQQLGTTGSFSSTGAELAMSRSSSSGASGPYVRNATSFESSGSGSRGGGGFTSISASNSRPLSPAAVQQQTPPESSPTLRLLAMLDSDPTNKICADCHTPLLERSRIYVSFHADPLTAHHFGAGSGGIGGWGGALPHGHRRVRSTSVPANSGLLPPASPPGGVGHVQDSGAPRFTLPPGDFPDALGAIGSRTSSDSPEGENSRDGAGRHPGDSLSPASTGSGFLSGGSSTHSGGSGRFGGIQKRGSVHSLSSAKTERRENRSPASKRASPYRKRLERVASVSKRRQQQQDSGASTSEVAILESSGVVADEEAVDEETTTINKNGEEGRDATATASSAPGVGIGSDFRSAHAAFTPHDAAAVAAPTPYDLSEIGNRRRQRSLTAALSEEERRRVLADRSRRFAAARARFGVFICAECASAHRALGPQVVTVKNLLKGPFDPDYDVAIMESAGGNACAKRTLERYMTRDWRNRVPAYSSTHEERQVFARAKYEAYAFLSPHGPLQGSAWSVLLSGENAAEAIASDYSDSPPVAAAAHGPGSPSSSAAQQSIVLPPRLVDFFCVIGPTGRLEPGVGGKTMTNEEVSNMLATDPERIHLEAGILHCYPEADVHRRDTPLPTHLPTFVFPEGCSPSVAERHPRLFTFVLTLETGTRLHGVAMHVYDDAVTSREFLRRLSEASSDGRSGSRLKLDDDANADNNGPTIQMTLSSASASSSSSAHPEVLLLPKCLVLLSHYPLHHAFRGFLQQLYRISLVEAPLPIERYVANFVCEVPLPPRGRVEVRYCMADDIYFPIRRPPKNHLPLVGVSYRPLFTTLSVGNVMVVVGCLLQEVRVAICSRHVAMLGSTCEALLSLLFPLVWQGCYIPVMPYSMLDVLDAPVPFLVGLHSRYLSENRPEYRPRGVVFVDLDNDVVHLGFEDEEQSSSGGEEFGRATPQLPEKEAAKLKAAVEEHGGVAYLSTSSGRKGRITYGYEEEMGNYLREVYAQETTVVWSSGKSGRKQKQASTAQTTNLSGLVRSSVLAKVDKAFPNDEHLVPIKSFITDKGTILQTDIAKSSSGSGRRKRDLAKFRKKPMPTSGDQHESSNRGKQLNTRSLLDQDADELHGFSALQVRAAFLRFFVSIFRNYAKYVNSFDDDEIFSKEGFLKGSGHLSETSHGFLSAVVSSQMFQRFIEEKLTDSNQHEIRFFDESIVAKKNRSTKSTLKSGGKKKDTPFLSDESDGAVTEIFSPPPPSNMGLPDDGRLYHYGSFPNLDPSLFGNTRTPKQWDQDLKQRWVANQSVLQNKLFSNLFTSSSSSDTPERDVVWAIHIMAYKAYQSKQLPSSSIGSDEAKDVIKRKKGVDDEASTLSTTVIPVAAGLLSSARRKQSRLLGLLSLSQATIRMYFARKHHRIVRMNAIYIQSMVRKNLLRRRYGRGLTRLYIKANDIQRVFRGNLERRIARTRLVALISIQSVVRGWLVKCYFEDLAVWAVTVQAILRGRRTRFAFKLVIGLVKSVQSCVRGWLTRRALAELVCRRIAEYRRQIFELWRRACTPLSYRAKFWTYVNGTGYMHLALHEDELIKLWLELGLKPIDYLARRSITIHNRNMRGVGKLANIWEMLGRKSVAVYKRFLVVQKKLDEVRSKTSNAIVPVFPCEIAFAANSGASSRKEEMAIAYKQLSVERAEIYEKLKFATSPPALNKMFSSFGIPMSSKRKKQRVVELLWEHKKYAEASFEVVTWGGDESRGSYQKSKRARQIFQVGREISVPISGTIDEHSTKWVQAMVHSRVDGDVVAIVRACLVSMQSLLQRQADQKADERQTRQRMAISAGMAGESWFDQRAVLIGEFMACGQLSAYYKHALQRLEMRTAHQDTVGLDRRRSFNKKKGAGNKAGAGSSRFTDASVGLRGSSAENAGANADKMDTSKRVANASKRTNFKDGEMDSFNRLLFESSA